MRGREGRWRQDRPRLPLPQPQQGEWTDPITHAAAATPGSPRTLNALVTLLLHSKLCLQDPVHRHLLGGSPSPLPIPVLVLPPLTLLLYRWWGEGGQKAESQQPVLRRFSNVLRALSASDGPWEIFTETGEVTTNNSRLGTVWKQEL